MRATILFASSLAASTTLLTACYMEVHDTNSDTPPNIDVTIPNEPNHQPGADASLNGTTPTRQWDRRCGIDVCQKSEVFVVYGLSQDLGIDNSVVLEAFDNPRFSGSPIASARLTGFSATRPGDTARTTLYLAPGSYYLRAFISSDRDAIAPYEYGGMELVSNKPVGFFGAASGPQSLHVEGEGARVPPVTVTLNHLFKTPEADSPSDAHLRIRFRVDPALVQVNQRLIIELRDTTDFAFNPSATFFVASDTLLVEGKEGQAEFTTRNLIPGDYSVLAFIDANNNGFADEDELQQTYSQAGTPALLRIAPRRTESIQLSLN